MYNLYKRLGEGEVIFLPFGSALCQPLYGWSKGSVLSEGDIGAFVYVSCYDWQRRYRYSADALHITLRTVGGLLRHFIKCPFLVHPASLLLVHSPREWGVLVSSPLLQIPYHPFIHPGLWRLNLPWKVKYLWNGLKSGLGCGPVEHCAWPSAGPYLQVYRPRHFCHAGTPIFLGADPPP